MTRVSFPAPALVQREDEELILAFGAIVYPGTVERDQDRNGLRFWVDGDARDPRTASAAAATFQTLLGIVRAFRVDSGELADEARAGLGSGSIRDEAGNQFLTVGPARVYGTLGGEKEAFATDVRVALDTSEQLGNALYLNGRSGRTAADYYMVHEYACMEFGGMKGVREELGLSAVSQDKLTQSANNLSPLEGGRHARQRGPAPWTLREQRDFVADLLRRWIGAAARR
jgi:hypothetical protein